jgi:hypothetical protein
MAGDNNIAETDGAAQSSVFAVTSAPRTARVVHDWLLDQGGPP